MLVESALSSSEACMRGDILSCEALKVGNTFTSPRIFTSRDEIRGVLA